VRFCILTLYPEMFPGVLGHALAGAALRDGLWELQVRNIRDYATDKHRTVDDTPYGGGAGMVMKADVVASAIDDARLWLPDAQLMFMTPRGTVLQQAHIVAWVNAPAPQDYIILCGRFEGIDERLIEEYQPIEVSIGDYVLFGGEVAAHVLMEAMLRHHQGVLGNQHTTHEESFTLGEKNACLLEYPHYTKPPLWNGRSVPEVLLSGHHQHIHAWRWAQAERITQQRRKDLWVAYQAQRDSVR
jgi:tRNA (guanine37-N1)-methyltransferase